MKTTLRLFITCFALFSLVSANAQIKIHCIGDSTMATYDPNTSDIRGWGMMFQQFFLPGVIVNNRAKNGTSSKSFYLEAPYWTSVKTQINPGDYVIIQFAHNDESNGGLDGGTDINNPINGANYKGTNPQTTYKYYLNLYIDETIALGATPILATSMCRKYFSSGSITRKGLHDLGPDYSLPATDHTYDYAFAMNEVAISRGVQIIDLTTLTKNLVESYGDTAAAAQLYVAADSTHPTALMGTLTARLCAQAMFSQNILAAYINTTADVLINPISADIGNGYTGQLLKKELTIVGFDLLPAAGTFSLSVSSGFQIALLQTDTFSSSINMNYSGGNLIFSKFYVFTTQTTGGAVNGTLTVTNGNITKTVPLNANFIELTGGTDVNLVWDLTLNDSYILTGPAIPVNQTHVGLTVQNYSAPSSTAVWPTESGYDATRKTQRNDPTGGTWPANEIDEVTTRYTQFGITASANTNLNIDNISMYLGGSGGGGMRCRIKYSTDDFFTSSAVGELPSMTSNQMYFVQSIPVVTLQEGQTFKVRVYPWYNFSAPATGKRICISDVKIHGIATPASVLGTTNFELKKIVWTVNDGYIKIANADKNSKISIYDVTGRVIYKKASIDNEILAPSSKGIYIGKIESPDGNSQTTKFLVQ